MNPLVLDTNIALDLFVFQDPATAPLREALERTPGEWIATAAMREELARVLAYPQIARRLVVQARPAQAVLDAFDRCTRLVAEAPKAAPKPEAKAEAPKDAGTIARADAATQTAPTAKADPTATGSAVVSAPAKAPSDGGRVFASPLAKRLAKEAGLDLTAVSGSGPHGRIVKADVEGAKATAAPVPAAIRTERIGSCWMMCSVVRRTWCASFSSLCLASDKASLPDSLRSCNSSFTRWVMRLIAGCASSTMPSTWLVTRAPNEEILS